MDDEHEQNSLRLMQDEIEGLHNFEIDVFGHEERNKNHLCSGDDRSKSSSKSSILILNSLKRSAKSRNSTSSSLVENAIEWFYCKNSRNSNANANSNSQNGRNCTLLDENIDKRDLGENQIDEEDQDSDDFLLYNNSEGLRRNFVNKNYSKQIQQPHNMESLKSQFNRRFQQSEFLIKCGGIGGVDKMTELEFHELELKKTIQKRWRDISLREVFLRLPSSYNSMVSI